MNTEQQDRREFDVIIQGATGFTGTLVAEYLIQGNPGLAEGVLERHQVDVDRWGIVRAALLNWATIRAALRGALGGILWPEMCQ